jgi:hypothetical protein
MPWEYGDAGRTGTHGTSVTAIDRITLGEISIRTRPVNARRRHLHPGHVAPMTLRYTCGNHTERNDQKTTLTYILFFFIFFF